MQKQVLKSTIGGRAAAYARRVIGSLRGLKGSEGLLSRGAYFSSGLFNADWYLKKHVDVRSQKIDPLTHYLRHGWREFRDPSPLFSVRTYFTLYPELQAAGIEPLTHYLLYGAKERRTCNPLFDPKWYEARYMAGDPSGLTPTDHFLLYGGDKGFWPHPLFDPEWYLSHSDGKATSAKSALMDLLADDRFLNRPSEFFDCRYYLDANPDVAETGLHPLLHYYVFGGFEGRNPSEKFDSQWYLDANPDVVDSKINPLSHFMHYGRQEGRSAKNSNRSSIKDTYQALSKLRFDAFIASNTTLSFPTGDAPPDISIILVLYNKANFSFDCLDSLFKLTTANRELRVQIIVFDNASSDETDRLLDNCSNLEVIRSSENIGFLLAVNQAVERARGRYLLFLNNDTQVPFGSLEAAMNVLDNDPGVGAVGGRLILPDATVQEAGSIIWRDGSCFGYGRGLEADDPAVMFEREVDYCSGAFLMTPTELFRRLNGFDEAFAPAYYEETDYCVRIWGKGLKVVYEPRALILHFEFGSAGSRESALRQQAKNKQIFEQKHKRYLSSRHVADRAAIAVARFAEPAMLDILIIEDRVPFSWLGSGFPRSKELVEVVREYGESTRVCFCATVGEVVHDWTAIRTVLDRRIEVVVGETVAKMLTLLKSRRFDIIIVCRPHNMQRINAIIDADASTIGSAKIIYDAEALFAAREIEKKRLGGATLTEEKIDEMLNEEIALTRNADSLITVSPGEKALFQSRSSKPIMVASHAVHAKPGPALFNKRSGFLFVGAIHADDTPNADSLLWLFAEVWPHIIRRLGGDAKLMVVGKNSSKRVADRKPAGVTLLGRVDDLESLYASSRVSLAPTRYSAGIPIKVLEAAGAGVPCVITPLLLTQLGWTHGVEALAAGDAKAFADLCCELYEDETLWMRVREAGLKSVTEQFSAIQFRNAVWSALDSVNSSENGADEQAETKLFLKADASGD